MDGFNDRIQRAFEKSHKLVGVQPNEQQLANVVFRLKQIFTAEELEGMDERQLARQVERVWPIARYVDRKERPAWIAP